MKSSERINTDERSEPRFGKSFSRADLWVFLAQQEDRESKINGFPEVWERFYRGVIEPSVQKHYSLGVSIGVWESWNEAENIFIQALADLECLHAVWDRAEKVAHDPDVGFEIVKDFRVRARSIVTEFAKFSPRQVLREKLLKVMRDASTGLFLEVRENVFVLAGDNCCDWILDPSLSGTELATQFSPRKGIQKHQNFPELLPTRDQIRELLGAAFQMTRKQLDVEQLHDFIAAVFRIPWKSEFATVSPTGEPEDDDETPDGIVPHADEIVEAEFAEAPKFIGREIERVIEFRDKRSIESGEGRFGVYFREFWLWSTELRDDGKELDVVEFGAEHGLEKSASYQLQTDFEAMVRAAIAPLIREHGHGTVRLALHWLRRKWAAFRP